MAGLVAMLVIEAVGGRRGIPDLGSFGWFRSATSPSATTATSTIGAWAPFACFGRVRGAPSVSAGHLRSGLLGLNSCWSCWSCWRYSSRSCAPGGRHSWPVHSIPTIVFIHVVVAAGSCRGGLIANWRSSFASHGSPLRVVQLGLQRGLFGLFGRELFGVTVFLLFTSHKSVTHPVAHKCQ